MKWTEEHVLLTAEGIDAFAAVGNGLHCYLAASSFQGLRVTL